MSMTLWVHTLDGRECSTDSDDHSWMYRLSDELDALCIDAEVTTLSTYFDFTELTFNSGNDFADEFDSHDEGDETDAEDSDEDDMDPETGLGYGIDDMTWFDSTDGIETLNALLEAIQSGALPDLGGRETDDLCEELEDCLKRLEPTAEEGGKFHLAVVE